MKQTIKQLDRKIVQLNHEYSVRCDIHGSASDSARAKHAEIAETKQIRRDMKRELCEIAGQAVLEPRHERQTQSLG